MRYFIFSLFALSLLVPKSGEAQRPDLLIAPFSKQQADAKRKKIANRFNIRTSVTNAYGMTFNLIPQGEFVMGSSDKPELRRGVSLISHFYMGTTEVTQKQWKAVMGTSPLDNTQYQLAYIVKNENHPIGLVSWDEVQRFIKKLNGLGRAKYRLPSESEWEFACRAGTTTRFYVGNSITDRQSNIWGDLPLQKTAKVKTYQPNNFGLYNMHGNVAEWCEDKTAQGLCSYRGGSLVHVPDSIGSGITAEHPQDGKLEHIGFRLLMMP